MTRGADINYIIWIIGKLWILSLLCAMMRNKLLFVLFSGVLITLTITKIFNFTHILITFFVS